MHQAMHFQKVKRETVPATWKPLSSPSSITTEKQNRVVVSADVWVIKKLKGLEHNKKVFYQIYLLLLNIEWNARITIRSYGKVLQYSMQCWIDSFCLCVCIVYIYYTAFSRITYICLRCHCVTICFCTRFDWFNRSIFMPTNWIPFNWQMCIAADRKIYKMHSVHCTPRTKENEAKIETIRNRLGLFILCFSICQSFAL